MPNTARKRAPTFAELADEKVEAMLGEYRESVRRLASGLALTSEERRDAARLLVRLGLPTTCLERDVVAARAMWQAATEYRRNELTLLYPHLFAVAGEWVRIRRREWRRRQYVLDELRRVSGL